MTKLREARIRERISMIELSSKAGISYANLSRHENGWTFPSRQAAERLAETLRMTVEQLFPDVDLKDCSGAVQRSVQPTTRQITETD
jgi:transcriptional regulator with XRE-family HTH domain